jgi:hypothetical protein
MSDDFENCTTTTKRLSQKRESRSRVKDRIRCTLTTSHNGSLTKREAAKISIPNKIHTQIQKVKNMAKIKKYEPKRVFLETLIGYIEATKCRTLNNFTEVKTQ